jgi:hypothetical protein
MQKECSDIFVVIRHPHGDAEISLNDWMRIGPGERKYIAPIEAKCGDDGRKLPISVIPLSYRNNWFSRWLIHLGILQNPWI